MTAAVSVSCPIQPHEIAKPMRDHLDDIVKRVVVAAAVEGLGRDLMLRVYLAGMHHGVVAAARTTGGTDAGRA